VEDAMILEGVPNYCIRRTVRRGWLGGTTSHGAPPPRPVSSQQRLLQHCRCRAPPPSGRIAISLRLSHARTDAYCCQIR